MPGLDRDLVEYHLPIMPEFHPFQQPPIRISKEVKLKVNEKIEKLLKAKFIRHRRCSMVSIYYACDEEKWKSLGMCGF